MMSKTVRMVSIFALFLGLMLCAPFAFAVADKDNHEQWEKPTENDEPDKEVPGFFVNLGPTGARAILTEKSTFVVRYIFKGSPAEKELKFKDEIVGVFGKPFSTHRFNPARGYEGPIMDLGNAIETAEGKDGKLLLNVKKAGASDITEVTIKLEPLGLFSPTFPYNCPKSQLLSARALKYFADRPDTWMKGRPHTRCAMTLAMLNSTDSKMQAIGKQMAQNWAGNSPDAGTWTWNLSFQLITLGEYHMLTKDASVVPMMQKVSDFLVKAQYSGKIKKWEAKAGEDPKKLHEAEQLYDGGFAHGPYIPMMGGYGPMQYTTILAVTAWQIAARCGIKVNQDSIDRGLKFIHRGTNAAGYVAYGGEFTLNNGIIDPVQWKNSTSGDNYVGRVGCAIVAHRLSPEFADSAEYLEKYKSYMIHAHNSMPDGHADANLGIFWGIVGAAASEDPKVFRTTMDYHKAYFNMMRCFDGSFVLQPGRDYADYGYYNSSRYHPTATMALAYGLYDPKLLIMGIQVNIPGVNPKALSGKLDYAYRAIVAKSYSDALKLIKSQRSAKNISEEDSATCDAMSGYLQAIFEKELASLAPLEQKGDFYRLQNTFNSLKGNFSLLEEFEEKTKHYKDGLSQPEWKAEIKLGEQYATTMAKFSVKPKDLYARILEKFAEKNPESLYGRWAKSVLEVYQAEGIVKDPAFGDAAISEAKTDGGAPLSK